MAREATSAPRAFRDLRIGRLTDSARVMTTIAAAIDLLVTLIKAAVIAGAGVRLFIIYAGDI
jgi:hypothetical protein